MIKDLSRQVPHKEFMQSATYPAQTLVPPKNKKLKKSLLELKMTQKCCKCLFQQFRSIRFKICWPFSPHDGGEGGGEGGGGGWRVCVTLKDASSIPKKSLDMSMAAITPINFLVSKFWLIKVICILSHGCTSLCQLFCMLQFCFFCILWLVHS